jgi:hypothetical protein
MNKKSLIVTTMLSAAVLTGLATSVLGATTPVFAQDAQDAQQASRSACSSSSSSTFEGDEVTSETIASEGACASAARAGPPAEKDD